MYLYPLVNAPFHSFNFSHVNTLFNLCSKNISGQWLGIEWATVPMNHDEIGMAFVCAADAAQSEAQLVGPLELTNYI